MIVTKLCSTARTNPGNFKLLVGIVLGAVILVVCGCAGLVSGNSSGSGSAATAALAISNPGASNVTSSGAAVSWQTNLPATSQVEYGTSTAYGSTTSVDSTMVTSHQQSLTSLQANTTYHYRVHSTDANNNAVVSNDLTFATASAPDTTPPTVSITSPASGSTVTGTVSVTANASDNVGVASVQFQLDGANLGSLDTASPYSVSWNTTTASNGSHTLTAIAKDAAGNSTTSAGVTVTVNNTAPDTTPPTVSITSPASGSTVTGTVSVTANASDNVGVASVQFQLDGANLGSLDTASPYSVSWNTTTASNGSHTLTAIAKDAAGNSTTSAGVTVTVNNGTADTTPPSVPTGLTATAVSSSQINLSWSASTDNVGVTGYKVYRGGTQIGTSSTASYSDTGLTASTSYSYSVAAYDAAGNTSAQSATASATTQAAPAPVPGHLLPEGAGWHQISNTAMQPNGPGGAGDKCPPNDSQFNFDSKCSQIVQAWGSGAYDTLGRRGIIWGGGHGDYLGNEIYTIDMSTSTPTINRVNAPTEPVNTTCVETIGNPPMPVSRHTYNNITFIPTTNEFYGVGGGGMGCELNATWTLNMNSISGSCATTSTCSAAWVQRGSGPSCNLDGKKVAFDPNRNLVFLEDRCRFWGYDPTTGNYTNLASSGAALYSVAGIDPVNKLFVVIGYGEFFSRSISAGSSYATTSHSSSSCSGLVNATYPGLDWDPTTNNLVGYPGSGNTIYLLNTTTWTCTTETYSGGPPTAAGGSGMVFGRWRYMPLENAFWYYPDYNQPAWYLRRQASGGVSGPNISGVNVGSITTTGAIVAWTTDVGATTQVEYGTTTSYGNLTTLNSTLVTSHSQALAGLTAGALYHYRVRSKNSSGIESISGDAAFSTNNTTDTTPPTVSMTAPANGATVSGSITVSANATDNVGVTSVQFMLDGGNLGSAVTSSPYQTAWNTTTTANGAHVLTAVARDNAGNTATAVGVSVTVSNTSSGTTELPLATRCADLAVTLCYAMDNAAVQLTPYISPSDTTPQLDTTTKTQSTNGSLMFTIPAAGNQGSAGYWTRTMGRDFNQGQTAYISFRYRMDEAFRTNPYNGNGWKLHIFWSGVGGSCSDLQLVTENTYYTGYPYMYRSCGTPGLVIQMVDGDHARQFGSGGTHGADPSFIATVDPSAGSNGYLCTSRGGTGRTNCANFVSNQWMTFYWKITIGNWNTANSKIEAWIAYEGQPMKKWLDLDQVNIPNDNTSTKALRQVDLLPYITGRTNTVSVDGHVWYAEVIVSGNPIPPPTGPTP